MIHCSTQRQWTHRPMDDILPYTKVMDTQTHGYIALHKGNWHRLLDDTLPYTKVMDTQTHGWYTALHKGNGHTHGRYTALHKVYWLTQTHGRYIALHKVCLLTHTHGLYSALHKVDGHTDSWVIYNILPYTKVGANNSDPLHGTLRLKTGGENRL